MRKIDEKDLRKVTGGGEIEVKRAKFNGNEWRAQNCALCPKRPCLNQLAVLREVEKMWNRGVEVSCDSQNLVTRH